MWVKALDSAPKEGTMVEVELEGKDLFIAMNNGCLYCGENRCPHEGIKLTLGCLKDGRIRCSLHGFSFDLATGESSQTDIENMPIYPIKQENNKIYIEV